MRMPKYTYDHDRIAAHGQDMKFWCVIVSYHLFNPRPAFKRKPTVLICSGSFSYMLWMANHQSTEHGYFKLDSFTEIAHEEFDAAMEFTGLLHDYKDKVVKAEEGFE